MLLRTVGLAVRCGNRRWLRLESPAKKLHAANHEADNQSDQSPQRSGPGDAQNLVERERAWPSERQREGRRGLLQGGPLRFSEIGARAHGVGDKILSARLKELEARGIVARHVECGPPVRVLYELTPKGQAFEHVAGAIERWGRELVDEGKKKRRRPA